VFVDLDHLVVLLGAVALRLLSHDFEALDLLLGVDQTPQTVDLRVDLSQLDLVELRDLRPALHLHPVQVVQTVFDHNLLG